MTAPDIYSEFYFNLGIERKFMNVLIINLVPLFVVALLLFATLMTMSRDERHAAIFGFSTSGFIGTCSALFFVVLLSHVQVRSTFAGSGLVYIEYFYLVMYLAILMAAVNAYLFSVGEKSRSQLVMWRENLLARIAYWPALTLSILVISLLVL